MTDAPGRVIVLIENWTTGHCESELKLLTAMILRWGWRVVVLYPEPQVISAWVREFHPEHLSRFFALTYVLNRRLKITRWNLIRDAISEVEGQTGWRVDLILFTFLASILSGPYWFARRFIPRPWAALYHNPTPHRSNAPMNLLRRKFLVYRDRCMLRSAMCRGVAVQDEETVDSLREQAGDRLVVFMPQVTDMTMRAAVPSALQAVKIRAGGRKIIGLIGLLERRKGLLNFVRLIQRTGPEKVFFVLAGKFNDRYFSKSERKELERFFALGNGDHWHLQLGYIEDDETVNAYIALCDIVYFAYEGHYHSSGVLAKAALLRKPVIASQGYFLGETVNRYKLGVTIAEGNLAELVAAVELLSDDAKYAELRNQAEYDRYVEAHTMQAFEAAMRQLLSR